MVAEVAQGVYPCPQSGSRIRRLSQTLDLANDERIYLLLRGSNWNGDDELSLCRQLALQNCNVGAVNLVRSVTRFATRWRKLSYLWFNFCLQGLQLLQGSSLLIPRAVGMHPSLDRLFVFSPELFLVA